MSAPWLSQGQRQWAFIEFTLEVYMKKGRFSQPRNGHFSDPSPMQQPPAGRQPMREPENVQQTWQQPGYDQNDWQQNSFQKEAYPQDDYGSDPYGGNGYGQDPYGQEPYGRNPRRQQPVSQKRGIGWGILSFFIPLVGLILALCWMRRKPRAAKSCGIGALAGMVTLILLVLLLVFGGKMYYDHMLDKVNIVEMTKPTYSQTPTEEAPMTEAAPTEAVTTEATEPPTTEPPTAQREDFVNFLIVGQAARANEDERFADTMLVCTLNKFDNSVTVTSLLRDSFVQPPPFRNKHFGHIKLTTVSHMGSYYDNGNVAGSMELINNTLYDNFGVEIDHNIEISFDVFTAVVDALGGVDMELTEAEAKYMTNYFDKLRWEEDRYNLEPGMAHLDGYMTLTFARMRKAEGDGESDIKRTARQRNLMEVLMKKFKTMSPADLQNIANEVLPMVTTNMTKEEITDTIKMIIPMLPTMEFKSGGTCPHNYSGVMVDIYKDGFYHSVLKFVPQNEKKYMRELTLGEVDGVPAGSNP